MAIRIHHGRSDGAMDEIVAALRAYEAAHSAAQIDLYRQNSVSVRIRVVDPELADLDRVSRHDEIWKFLDSLSEDRASEISMLLLLSPDEIDESFANIEFEDPLPSRL